MYKSGTKCNETLGKWCKNKHGASKIMDTSETYQLAQTFGMTAEYARLKGETDLNVLPDVGRSRPDQAFDATQDSKKIKAARRTRTKPPL
jgi:hypothetical protein